MKRMLRPLAFLWLGLLVCLICHLPSADCINSRSQHLSPVPPSSSASAKGTRGRLDLVKDKRRRCKKSPSDTACNINVRGGQDVLIGSSSSSSSLQSDLHSNVHMGSNYLSNEASDLYRVAHGHSSADLLTYLQTNEELGLSHAEAEIRLNLYGKNVLRGEVATSIWNLMLEQIQDRLVQILLCVAISTAND